MSGMNIRRWLQGVDRGLVKWVGPAGFALGLLLAVAIGLPTGIDIYQNWQNIDPSERSQAGITLLQTLFTIVGGVAIFWNIVLSRRQLAATELTAVSFSPKTIAFRPTTTTRDRWPAICPAFCQKAVKTWSCSLPKTRTTTRRLMAFGSARPTPCTLRNAVKTCTPGNICD